MTRARIELQPRIVHINTEIGCVVRTYVLCHRTYPNGEQTRRQRAETYGGRRIAPGWVCRRVRMSCVYSRQYEYVAIVCRSVAQTINLDGEHVCHVSPTRPVRMLDPLCDVMLVIVNGRLGVRPDGHVRELYDGYMSSSVAQRTLTRRYSQPRQHIDTQELRTRCVRLSLLRQCTQCSDDIRCGACQFINVQQVQHAPSTERRC